MNGFAPDSTLRLPRRQHGSALIVGLVLLMVLTVLGVAALSGTTLQERMAGNLRDRNLAFQGAEVALRDGEVSLQQAALPAFGAGNPGLLLRQDLSGSASLYWNEFDWDGDSRLASTVDGLAARPRYVIEELPSVPGPGDSVRFGPLPDVGVYRITARSVGGTEDAVVILQSTYRR